MTWGENLKNTSLNDGTAIEAPSGDLYIKTSKKIWYILKEYKNKLDLNAEDLEEVLEKSESKFVFDISWVESTLYAQRWLQRINDCPSNCSQKAILYLLEKHAYNHLPFIIDNTPRVLLDEVESVICPKCRVNAGILAYYSETLSAENLIRRGYFSKFLNKFDGYKYINEEKFLKNTDGCTYYSCSAGSAVNFAFNTIHADTEILGGIFNFDRFFEWVNARKEEYFWKESNGESNVEAVREWTTPIIYNSLDINSGRKEYKLPNLFSYANMVYYIDANKDRIIDIFLEDGNSISKFFDCPIYSNQVKNEIKLSLLLGCSKRRAIELQNFPDSIYTHSLEWALGGKVEAKKSIGRTEIDGNLKMGRDFDVLLQSSQNGETHGIPWGSTASQVIVEMYMCKLDKALVDKGVVSFARDFDNITFSYNTESDLVDIEKNVRDTLGEYNLGLNNAHTKDFMFPFIELSGKESIINYFDRVPLCSNLDIESKNINNINLSIRENIYKFIDYCSLEECKGNEGSLGLMIPTLIENIMNGSIDSSLSAVCPTHAGKYKSVLNIILNPDPISNLSIFEKILDLCLMHPEITQEFIDFSRYIVYVMKVSGMGPHARERIVARVHSYFSKMNGSLGDRIHHLLRRKNSQELHSLLMLIIIFDYDIVYQREEEVKEICKLIVGSGMDDISLILATMIYYRKFNNFNDLLDVSAKVLWMSHRLICTQDNMDYSENDSLWYTKLCSCGKEFSGELWMYRYFMYSLSSDKGYEAEESSGGKNIHKSFRESLSVIECEKNIPLEDHFKFRLTKEEVKKRIESGRNAKKLGMIVHMFYREMLDAGIRFVNPGNWEVVFKDGEVIGNPYGYRYELY